MFEILKYSLPLLGIAIFGYVCARTGVLGDKTTNFLNDFVFFVALPIQMLLQACENNIAKILQPDYLNAFMLSTVIMAVMTYFIMRKRFPQGMSSMALTLMSTSQVNCTYLAIPIFTIFLGNALAVIPILLYQGIVSTAVALTMIEMDINARKGVKVSTKSTARIIWRVVITTPIIGASIVGMVMGIHEAPLPKIVSEIGHLLDGVVSPIVFFTLGLSLGTLPISLQERAQSPEIVWISVLKNIVHPTLAYVLGKYLFGMQGKWLLILVMVAAQPSARNIFTFSQRYGLDVQKSNVILIVTTLFSFIVLNILLMSCGIY
jgi:predicted permease